MKHIVFIIVFILLILSCSKKEEQNKFLISIDSLLEKYKYTEVIGLTSKKLREEKDNLDSSFKAEIYWRYAFAVSMKNRGAIHFTILDSLKRYSVDSLFFQKRDNMIKRVQKEFNDIRADLNNEGDMKELIVKLDRLLLEYPSFDKAKHLKDSLENVLKGSND